MLEQRTRIVLRQIISSLNNTLAELERAKADLHTVKLRMDAVEQSAETIIKYAREKLQGTGSKE